MALRIYNSLTREKQDFVPLQPGENKMYVCGITSSGPSHVGHARAFVAFDVVYRWLRRSNQVLFVRNTTDVDDKIINAARAAGEDIATFTARQIAHFESDMAELGCAKPSVEPRVTQHIGEIIDLIARLERKGFAYAHGGGVYFQVPMYKPYGRLSGRTQEVLNAEAYRAWAGGRLEIPPGKTSPYDFALWKAEKPGEPAWDSPWGRGRPGWHIECSAMSMKYLGEMFDIHTGAVDNIFLHHENELAQSECATGKPFVKYWMHNGLTRIKTKLASGEWADEKMSGSIGNVVSARELIDKHGADLLRYLLLSTHYRRPIEFTEEVIANARKGLNVFTR